MAAILLGALAGQTAQSLFEAWWVAPGSPEAAYFWAMSGVAVGLSLEMPKARDLPEARRHVSASGAILTGSRHRTS